MTHFSLLIKAEISRLAKKEVRAETQVLKKASAQYRTDIAALKRQIASLENTVKQISKETTGKDFKRDAGGESSSLRFRMKGFVALRKKLGLTAADMGRLIGVSGQSIYHWETGKTRPRASQLKAIAAVRKLGKRAVAAKLASAQDSAGDGRSKEPTCTTLLT